MRIILASQSAARKRALDILGLKYDVVPSNFDEFSIRDTNPHHMVKKLAEAKAAAISNIHPAALVIAGDLVCCMDHRIYEKPNTEQEAHDMLRAFSGKEHEIIAGLAVMHHGKLLSSSKTTRVRFRTLTDLEIRNYISRYPVCTFSGGYDYEGVIRFAEHVNGNMQLATGLPIEDLVQFLREFGVDV